VVTCWWPAGVSITEVSSTNTTGDKVMNTTQHFIRKTILAYKLYNLVQRHSIYSKDQIDPVIKLTSKAYFIGLRCGIA